MENANDVLIFVYGSLLSELHNHRYLEREGVELVGTDTIDGRIYTVHYSYPALDKDGQGVVKGEVYSVPPIVLKDLDRLEGYSPEYPEMSMYVRSRIKTHGGRTVIVYSMGDRMKEHYKTQSHIASGDWRAQFALNKAEVEESIRQRDLKAAAARQSRKTKKK